jgi:hypothetical protein
MGYKTADSDSGDKGNSTVLLTYGHLGDFSKLLGVLGLANLNKSYTPTLLKGYWPQDEAEGRGNFFLPATALI